MTAQYATARDPSSGGRQMPGHYGIARAQPRVGVVAGRDPAAPRGRDRPGGQDPQDRPGRDDHRWARARRTRATSTRASTSRRSTSCRSSSSSRTTAMRSACRLAMEVAVEDVADRASGYGIPGVVVDGVGRARLLRGGARRGRPGPRGRGPDADRGQGHPADRATPRTTSRPSTAPRRSSTPGTGHDAAAARSASSSATPAS